MADQCPPQASVTMDAEYVCGLDAATEAKAQRELNEVPGDRLAAVAALRDWVTQQPHITCRTGETTSRPHNGHAEYPRTACEGFTQGNISKTYSPIH